MDKLKDIISEYVGVSADNIDSDMSLVGDIGLDSFGLISLLGSIEDEFEVKIPDSALSSFQTFNDLTSFLEENSPVYSI